MGGGGFGGGRVKGKDRFLARSKKINPPSIYFAEGDALYQLSVKNISKGVLFLRLLRTVPFPKGG